MKHFILFSLVAGSLAVTPVNRHKDYELLIPSQWQKMTLWCLNFTHNLSWCFITFSLSIPTPITTTTLLVPPQQAPIGTMQDFDKSRAWKAVVVQMAQWAVLQYTEKVGGGKKMEWNIPNKLYSSLQKKTQHTGGKSSKDGFRSGQTCGRN